MTGTFNVRGWRTDTTTPLKFSGGLEDVSKAGSAWVVTELVAPETGALFCGDDVKKPSHAAPGLATAPACATQRSNLLRARRVAARTLRNRVLTGGATGGLIAKRSGCSSLSE